MTILCGDPPACCLDTEECVGGACEPICDSGVRCGVDQTTCCPEGQVCIADACAALQGACTTTFDCDDTYRFDLKDDFGGGATLKSN